MKYNLSRFDLNVGGIAITAYADPMSPEQWVAVQPICEVLGIAGHRQRQKLKENPQYNPQHMLSVGGDSKDREMLCLPIEELGMWLCGIQANRTKPEIREKLITFQKRMQLAIYDAITGKSNRETIGQLTDTIADLQQENLDLRQYNKRIEQRLVKIEQKQEARDSLEATFAATRLAGRRWEPTAVH